MMGKRPPLMKKLNRHLKLGSGKARFTAVLYKENCQATTSIYKWQVRLALLYLDVMTHPNRAVYHPRFD